MPREVKMRIEVEAGAGDIYGQREVQAVQFEMKKPGEGEVRYDVVVRLEQETGREKSFDVWADGVIRECEIEGQVAAGEDRGTGAGGTGRGGNDTHNHAQEQETGKPFPLTYGVEHKITTQNQHKKNTNP